MDILHIFTLVIYRVFNYLRHHAYYVSINSFIYYVSKNNFLEQHVYKKNVVYVLDFRLTYFGMSWKI